MSNFTSLGTHKLLIGAISAGALVLGGAGVAAVAAPSAPAVEQPESTPTATDTQETAEAPETEAPETEAPDVEETEAPEVEAPEAEGAQAEAAAAAQRGPSGPSEHASDVAQRAWAAAHVQGDARYPGSVADAVHSYVPKLAQPNSSGRGR
jgi:hypothetical protein